MKLSTLKDGTRDGCLVVVSRDLTRFVPVPDIAPTLQAALDAWSDCAPALRERFDALQAGTCTADRTFDAHAAMAPLPRAYQWCDGSAFLHHGRLMEKAFKHAPRPTFETVPLLYQGGSDAMLGARDDVVFPAEAHGIDFEGEYAVITTDVPMSCSASDALAHIVLLTLANDWSLRHLIPAEMGSGFGFFQGKPATSFAPVAITPDELGPHWRDGRVELPLHVEWNSEPFGCPNGREMHFDFGDLIAHAARTRRLGAGTIVGSGTVSNVDRAAGSACISERRVIEVIDHGAARTTFMADGDRVRMQARLPDGSAPFGVIDQRVSVATGASALRPSRLYVDA